MDHDLVVGAIIQAKGNIEIAMRHGVLPEESSVEIAPGIIAHLNWKSLVHMLEQALQVKEKYG